MRAIIYQNPNWHTDIKISDGEKTTPTNTYTEIKSWSLINLIFIL